MLRSYRTYSDLDMEQILSIYKGAIGRDYPVKNPWDRSEIIFLEDLRLFFRCTNASLFAWEHNGILVSALRLEPYKDGYLISCLETPLTFRRKGFASHLLEAVLSTVQQPVYAHVSKNNIPSIKLHEKVGFTKYADNAVFIDGSVFSSYFTLIYK